MEDSTMKKDYLKPQMLVVKIQQPKMLCASSGANSLVVPGGEGFEMPDGGVLDENADDV